MKYGLSQNVTVLLDYARPIVSVYSHSSRHPSPSNLRLLFLTPPIAHKGSGQQKYLHPLLYMGEDAGTLNTKRRTKAQTIQDCIFCSVYLAI